MSDPWAGLTETQRRQIREAHISVPRCRACASTSCPGIEGGIEACPLWQEAEQRREQGEYLPTTEG